MTEQSERTVRAVKVMRRGRTAPVRNSPTHAPNVIGSLPLQLRPVQLLVSSVADFTGEDRVSVGKLLLATSSPWCYHPEIKYNTRQCLGWLAESAIAGAVFDRTNISQHGFLESSIVK